MSGCQQYSHSRAHRRHARADSDACLRPQQAYRCEPISCGYENLKGNPSDFANRAGNTCRKKSVLWHAAFWISFVVLAISLIVLGTIAFSYWQGRQVYRDIEQVGFTPPSDMAGTTLADFVIDWDELKAVNPDTVGWIYVPGTDINYPIVQAADNETYLTHDFKGSEGWIATFGAIFLDAGNTDNFTDANNIIYGHHLNDGSMFAGIADMEEPDVFDASRMVYILTPQGNYKLKTFSLVHCGADDPLVQMSFETERQRVEYVQDKADRSVVNVADAPQAADIKQTFAFSTCDNLPTDGRWVLFAYTVDSTVSKDAYENTTVGPADNLVDPHDVAVISDASKDAAA